MGEYKAEEQQARNELHDAERDHRVDGVVSATKRLKALGVDVAEERKGAAAKRKADAEAKAAQKPTGESKVGRNAPPVDRSARPSGEKTA
jgi:hypothetical protein